LPINLLNMTMYFSMNPIEANETIFVAGHRGMVGSAIVRRLQALRHSNILTATHAELDLTNQAAVQAFLPRTP